MMPVCANLQGMDLIGRLLGNVDCQVRSFAEWAHQILSAGSGYWLSGILTLYVAIFGFRLMFGHASLRLDDITLSLFKIGLVIALATSEPFYQNLLFAPFFDGPLQVGNMLLIQGGYSAPWEVLQGAFDELQTSALFLSRDSSTLAAFSPGVPFTSASLNLAAFVLVFSGLGPVLAARIVLGILLASAPLMAALLLFDTTRGIFEGWLKSLLFLALVPVVAALCMMVELSMLGSYISDLAQMRALARPDLSLANSAILLVAIFAAVSVLSLAVLFLMARGLQFPRLHRDKERTKEVSTSIAPVIASSELLMAPSERLTRALERQERFVARADVAGRVLVSAARESEQPSPQASFFALAYRKTPHPGSRRAAQARDQR